MREDIEISTRRLQLRPFQLSDSADVASLAGDVEIYRATLTVPHPYSIGAAEQWIKRSHASAEEGVGVCLAVTRKSDGVLVGAVSLSILKHHARGELGYWVGVPYWQLGYATEAASATTHYAFETLALNKITARHFLINPASGRVLEKVGLVREGILRQEILKEGKFHDIAVYGQLASARGGQD